MANINDLPKNYTRLKDRILYFDGESAWESDKIVDLILEHGPDMIFSIQQLPGVQQKTGCGLMPLMKWNIPEEYLTRDIETELLEEASGISTEATNRVREELEEYKARDMLPLLRVLLYIRDKFEKEGVVWGVGRGSSVASYVLFLMKIHLVDSLKFELSIKEFLR